jgi:transposase
MREHISMRKIREILRLKMECQCSDRLIGYSVGAGRSTVNDCLKRAEKAQLSWPLPPELDDEKLLLLLYPPNSVLVRHAVDWSQLHEELKRKGVTLQLLWNEYKEKEPTGVSYSRFCWLYQQWSQQLEVWMRQPHKAGEKCFVDYSGQKMPIIVGAKTGEIREAEIFVAVLGASNYTFAEASWTQQLPDWIASHVRAFEFFGGVPEMLVPDNLKSGVQKAHRYEPDMNPTYQDMACHYGIAVIPARVNTPKDKAKVENAVLQVERHILAKLRHHQHFSLYELNQSIAPLLKALNQKPFQKIAGSRESQFDVLDKPALKPLPTTRYVFAQWKQVRAGADYHVELDSHYYSVPYTLTKKVLDVRYTQQTVEIFYKSKRVASHLRSRLKHQHTTVREHMPKRHQLYAEWTPQRLTHWAAKIGNATAELVEIICASRNHPQQGFRACLGILRLAKIYTDERLESACQRAIAIGAHSYKSVESILKNGLDKKPLSQAASPTIPIHHDYVRGKNYFN